MNKLINDKIRETQAATAWNTYVAWKNGPEANKLKGEELAAAAVRQAKLACFEQGLTLNSKDANADALKVLDFRNLDRSDSAAVDAFLTQNGPADLTTWATALEQNAGKGREAFYKAINVEATDWAKVLPELTKWVNDITNASTRIAAVAQNPTVAEVMVQYGLGSFGAATVGDGINVKEAGDAIIRLQKQIAVTGKQLPWLIDAIQTAD